MTPLVIVLSDDLIFTSRITGSAETHGAKIKALRSIDEVISLAQREPPSCIIVDLALVGARLGDLVAVANRPRIVAYGSHVDAAGLQAARDAGCDVVLPRSKFVEVLSTDLPRWLGR